MKQLNTAKATDSHSQNQKTPQKSLFRSLSFEDWDLIWTQFNYSDLTGDVLQTEVTAPLKPWQISPYMSLLHQQFSFPGTLNSAERSPIPSLQYIENSYSLAPEAVHLQKTGTKFNNKLNLSASSWLGLNKHLFLRQQKTHFILFF